jgi:predicted transcriptional regulator
MGSQPATASEISRVIGRPRDVVMQRLDELIKRGYVEHRGNRYKMTTIAAPIRWADHRGA